MKTYISFKTKRLIELNEEFRNLSRVFKDAVLGQEKDESMLGAKNVDMPPRAPSCYEDAEFIRVEPLVEAIVQMLEAAAERKRTEAIYEKRKEKRRETVSDSNEAEGKNDEEQKEQITEEQREKQYASLRGLLAFADSVEDDIYSKNEEINELYFASNVE